MGMKYEKKDFPRLYGTLYAIGDNSVIWTDGNDQIEVEIQRIASQRDMSKESNRPRDRFSILLLSFPAFTSCRSFAAR